MNAPDLFLRYTLLDDEEREHFHAMISMHMLIHLPDGEALMVSRDEFQRLQLRSNLLHGVLNAITPFLDGTAITKEADKITGDQGMQKCTVVEATHVKDTDGRIERIISKRGIGKNGELAPPSKGGFSVVTESGRAIDMWHASAYYRE